MISIFSIAVEITTTTTNASIIMRWFGENFLCSRPWWCPFAKEKKWSGIYILCCFGHHLAFHKLYSSLIRNKGSGLYAHSTALSIVLCFVLHSHRNGVKKTRQNKRKRCKQKGLVAVDFLLGSLITRIPFFLFVQNQTEFFSASYYRCCCRRRLEFVGHRFVWITNIKIMQINLNEKKFKDAEWTNVYEGTFKGSIFVNHALQKYIRHANDIKCLRFIFYSFQVFTVSSKA